MAYARLCLLSCLRSHDGFWVGLGLGMLLFESSRGQSGSAYMKALISISGLYVWVHILSAFHVHIHISSTFHIILISYGASYDALPEPLTFSRRQSLGALSLDSCVLRSVTRAVSAPYKKTTCELLSRFHKKGHKQHNHCGHAIISCFL